MDTINESWTIEAQNNRKALLEALKRIAEQDFDALDSLLNNDELPPILLALIGKNMELTTERLYITTAIYDRPDEVSFRMWSSRPEILSNGHPNRAYNTIATSTSDQCGIGQALGWLCEHMQLLEEQDMGGSFQCKLYVFARKTNG